MPDSDLIDRARLRILDRRPAPADASAELVAGLSQRPRRIAPRFFYDQAGSELFGQITDLPEYYLTRSERSILRNRAGKIAAQTGTGCVVIEPGSGDCGKIRLLLEELRPSAYVPVDISAELLEQSARKLAREYPWLSVHALCADFNSDDGLPADLPAGRRLAFYPGSTIGNLEPLDARLFLERMSHLIGDDGGLLVGFDLVKDSRVLEAAYNDSQGITAAFNRNILANINRQLDADFDPGEFEHLAYFNTDESRIEMHLVSRRPQTISHRSGQIELGAGEWIHTENSYKYSDAGFTALANAAGLTVQARWTDDSGLFALVYLES